MSSSTTVPSIRGSKRAFGAPPLAMVTAYDTPTAACADAGGVDMILVGDSLGHVVLGYESALEVSVGDMAHHVAAVARAAPRALVVADLPWLSYHTGPRDAVRNAARLIRAGAGAVKLEGCRPRVVEALLTAEIPVMGHLGVTPQSDRTAGGFEDPAAYAGEVLIAASATMSDAGCFGLVLSCVPPADARRVTEEVPVPTIGFGSGPSCDGQVLILHDLVGLARDDPPAFVRRYATVGTAITEAVASYCADVRGCRFPGPAETGVAGRADPEMTLAARGGRAD